MKILKRPDTAWSYKCTCSRCTAELEVEKTDVTHASYPGDYREPGYDTWKAYCPLCGNCIDITESAIPKAVQVEILRKKSSSICGGGWMDR